VGTRGRVKEIDRLDPTGAWRPLPTRIRRSSGEIRRYFRDTERLLYVARCAQQLPATLARACPELTQ
jgi:hypothetical protein